MDVYQRLDRLEKSNKYYKIALAICVCLFMVSAKDIFIKDEIYVKTLTADKIIVKDSLIAIDKKGTINDSLILNSYSISLRHNRDNIHSTLMQHALYFFYKNKVHEIK